MANFLYTTDFLLEFLVKVALTVVATPCILPINLLIFPALLLYRTFVIRLVKHWNPGFGEPLDLTSSVVAGGDWPFKHPSVKYVILGIFVVEGIPNIQGIKDNIREAWFRKKDNEGKESYPQLLQTVEIFMGYPFFKRVDGLDEDKVLEKYVRLQERNGGWDTDSMLEFSKTFAVNPFPKDSLLRGIEILKDCHTPNDGNKPQYACLLRAHHSLSDRLGLFSLIRDVGMRKDPKETCDAMRGKLPKRSNLLKVLKLLYRGVYDIVSSILNGVALTSENTLWPEPPGKVKCTTRATPEYSAAHSLSIDTTTGATLSSVSKVSREWGVILTAVLRSCRRNMFLGTTGAPSYIAMPIPLNHPGNEGKLGNMVLFISPCLPLTIEDPYLHSVAVDKGFQASKSTCLPHFTAYNAFSLIPTPAIKLAADPKRTLMYPEFLGFSTSVGPTETTYLFGQPTTDVSIFLPAKFGQKTPVIQVTSIADKLYFTLTADKNVVENDALARRAVLGIHEEISKFLEYIDKR